MECKVFLSPGAQAWQAKIADMVRRLPKELEERQEHGAAGSLRALLDNREAARWMELALGEFHLAQRQRPSYRQGAISDLRKGTQRLFDEALALGDRRAAIFGAMVRSDRMPQGVDMCATSVAFQEAIEALHYLSVLMADTEAAIIAAEGQDRGGPPMSEPVISHFDRLAEKLALVWIEGGRGLRRKEGSQYLAVLRCAREAITGDPEIPDENRVMKRVRAWADLRMNPPEKFGG